jgi:hypothetical protein
MNTKSKSLSVLTAAAFSLTLFAGSAVASTGVMHHSKAKGAVVGAVAGHMVAGKKGAVAGAAIGAERQHMKNKKATR